MRPPGPLFIPPPPAPGSKAAPPPDTTAEAKQAIDAANASWARLTATGHADSLAQYYHANAVIMPPNMTPVHGRDSIRAFFTVLNTMSSPPPVDRKSTRLNSSHSQISYAVFCLKKKKTYQRQPF